jgi:ABC-type multidrug transport system fused ATPase/permease subunit
MIITSLTEVVSIGAIIPFLGVLNNPDWFFKTKLGNSLAFWLKLDNPIELILPLTITFIFVILLSNTTRLLLLWLQTKLSYAIGGDLSYKVYQNILYQPYEQFLNKNSSEFISVIGKSKALAWSVVVPILTIISSVLMLVMIFITLLVINPSVLLLSVLFIFSFYFTVIKISKNKVKIASEIIENESAQVIKTMQEGIGGIRDIIIDGTHALYSKLYISAELPSRNAQSRLSFIGASPRYALEAFGMIFIIITAFKISNEGLNTAIPILGSLALGAQRMMPLLQQIYNNWTNLKGGENTIQVVINYLDLKIPDHYLLNKVEDKLLFQSEILINNVKFKYHEKGPYVLDDINFKIKKGDRIGIIGITGSGKSTLIDLIMGLLEPTSGDIRVDEHIITSKNIKNWQKNIAHVPQVIFLTDGTIAENVAFGVSKDRIDFSRVKDCIEKAQMRETIENLDQGLNSIVGERGSRLSGGQRQRIGIARALYKKSDIIIFDEATSALDNITENKIIETINSLGDEITIIMIAHRVTTLEKCTKIIRVENGKVEVETH